MEAFGMKDKNFLKDINRKKSPRVAKSSKAGILKVKAKPRKRADAI